MNATLSEAPQKTNHSSNQINTGPALMRWRRERGIPRKLFAQMADCSERKLATYEKAVALPKNVMRPIIETVRLIQTLQTLAGNDDAAVREWLEKPNPAFEGQKPLNLIIEGKIDRLWEMAYQVRHGEFG